VATVDTVVDGIATTLGAAGAGLTAVPWNAAWDAEVESEGADALGVYDPPTNAEMVARTLVAEDYVVVGDTLAAVTTVGAVTGAVGSVTGAVGSVAAGGITASSIADAAIDNATFAADVGSTAYATNVIALALRKALDEIKLDHLVAVADSDDPVNNSIIAKLAASDGDWSGYALATDSLEAIRDKLTDIETDTAEIGAAGIGLTAVALAATGLDSISTTAPAGVASNFREMLVQVWRRHFKRSTLTSTELKTYADDDVSVLTTQVVSDDGTVQTMRSST
jgi:hypothetical protein